MTTMDVPGAYVPAPAHDKGDRFVSRDERRAAGKTVEVDVVGVSVRDPNMPSYLIRTETHPLNPSAVGRRRWIREDTLDHNYRKISH